ncbi:DUF296 domain-containing protein [Sphingobacterium sp. KB22]|uniref:DUF296 domain-containing protein n=2 Tax=Sphingobacterium hungaricum TaxID=2082723 RepID=A0A928UX13_9SPHI|nr:DUF296 domain-containing protein [Sphingobacterium hungaricum]
MQTQAQQVLKGSLWTAKKVEQGFIISINDKASITDALTDFVTQNKIVAGNILGVGAVNEATLRFFDPETKEYVDKTFKEQMEISNITGNIAVKDGKPYLHVHATLGRKDYTALAGHLEDGKIRGAGEIFIMPIQADIQRIKSEEIGLNVYDFK